ncbi:MAG TPA: hypothetical protein VEA18_01415, partial [Candidatus Kapabacteria bacterium]|nr:hypothetical protein [Candidatus Kapabacteria bacterium]
DEGIAHLAFLLRRQTKRYDALPILKEIYQGEIFSHVEGTIIHIYDENGKIMRTIEPPEPFKDGPFSFDTAKISPNKRFVLTTIGIGDGGHAWIYDIQNDSLHEVTEGFGLGELGWLADNRIVLHSGCVAAEYCKRLESVSSETPWVVEVVKDLGRYE